MRDGLRWNEKNAGDDLRLGHLKLIKPNQLLHMKIRCLSVGGMLLLGGMLLAGCQKDEPDKPHPGEGQVSITIGETQPALAAVCLLYPLSGPNAPVEKKTEAIAGEWKVEEWLPLGSYQAVVCGFDTREIALEGAGSLATARLAVRNSQDTGVEPLTKPVYLATSSEWKLEEEKTTALRLQPVKVSHVLCLNVHTGAGFNGATLQGSLSGIASSFHLAAAKPDSRGGALKLDWQPAAAPGDYQATAGMFGPVTVAEKQEKVNLLSLTLTTAAGETFSFEEDLTDRLAQAVAAGRDTFAIELSLTPAVPIRLYTGILTRATVDAFDGTPLSIAVGRKSGEYSEHWEGEASGKEIRLHPERYYPTDGSAYYLRSYYPAMPHENGEVHYMLTGQEDLMISAEQSGSVSERFDAAEKPLMHRHLLSQLNFTLQFKGVTGDYRLRSVQLKGLASSVILSLGSAQVQAAGKADPVIVYADPGTGGVPVIDGKVTLPGYVLVQPDAEFTLDLVLAVDEDPAHDKVFKDVPVHFEAGGSQGGNAYNVEISLDVSGGDTPVDPDDTGKPDVPVPTPPGTLDDFLIQAKATVIPWKNGEGGSAIL